MSLTERMVQRLEPNPRRQYEKRDHDGLAIRVSPGGTKSWVFLYHFADRKRRHTLGRWPHMSLKEARKAHASARTLLFQGTDPASAKLARERQERAAIAVSELVEQYLEGWARPRKRSAGEDERILRAHVLSAWGTRSAKDITRRDVIRLLNQLTSNGMGAGANRVLAVVRRMYSWAIEQDILDTTPCYGVRPPAPERVRDRVLSWDEIAHFWAALDGEGVSSETCFALRLQLVTGQRIGEVIGATWDEIDVRTASWSLPGSRTKSGRRHNVHLSALAINLLSEIRRLHPRSPWLFPSKTRQTPISNTTVAHALGKNREANGATFGLPYFTTHDLRRTTATRMAELGISLATIRRILNHADQGVTATVYTHYGYQSEKKHALDLWADKLQEILGLESPAQDVG